jgi:hypothetical protein
MNKNDLPKGYIPVEGKEKKRWRLDWKYIIALFVFLVVTYTIRNINRDTIEDKASKAINRQGPLMALAVGGLSPQELEHLQDVRDRADEIFRKYLTPDEYTQTTSISLKVAQGITTADEITWADFYWKKVRSLSSPSEKETLDEFRRLAQRLRTGY